MKKPGLILIAISLASLLRAQTNGKDHLTETAQTRIAASLSLRLDLLNNFYQGKRQVRCALTFVNSGKEPLPATGWALYFNALAGPPSGETAQGLISQDLSGCLFRFVPSGNFRGLAPGDSLRLEYVSGGWAVNITDAPSGWYMVWDNAPGKGISVTRYVRVPIASPALFDRYPGDRIAEATPEFTYYMNQKGLQGETPDGLPLFPTPGAYAALADSTAYYNGGPIVTVDPQFEKEASYLQQNLKELTGTMPKVESSEGKTEGIFLVRGPDTIPAEGYHLRVAGGKITIEASAPAGMFYGIQTLLHLFSAGDKAKASFLLPAVNITDQPRFGYRGLMIDVGRNFQSQREILRIIDLMAFCKLNILHFHLTDDEGWRLQVPSLPELTEVGAKRGHTISEQNWLRPCYGSGPDTASASGSGYYTRAQFIEILRYARGRHIQVIPEIESPGHARAAVKAMDNRYRRLMGEGRKEEALEFLLRDTADQSVYSTPQFYHDNVMNVALPSVYRFIARVTSEIVSMYKDAGVPLQTIHLGGDEVPAGVWEKSPACLSLLSLRVKGERAGANPSPVNTLWYYYFNKVDSILKAEGLFVSAWEEAGMRKTLLDGKPYVLPNPDFAQKDMRLYIWNNGDGAEDLAYRMANAGYKVVLAMASHLYFDMSYNKSFDEFGYYWATFQDVDKPFAYIPFDFLRLLKEDTQGNLYPAGFKTSKEHLTDFGKSNVDGMEGCLWGESLHGPGELEYKLLPKLLGMAERAWAPDPAWATMKDSAAAQQAYTEAWTNFLNTIGRQVLPALDHVNGGYAYRIAPPGVLVREGKVLANDQLPGFTIRYSVNGKDPDVSSPEYTGPITAKGHIRLRAFNEEGRGSRVVEVVNQ